MRFALETETREFAASVDALLDRADMPSVVRSWNDGDTAPGLRVWERLAETGAFALLLPEELDGMGATAVEAMAAVEVMGRHAVPGPVVETLMVAPRVLGGVSDAAEVAALVAGGTPVTVACPPASPYAPDAQVAERVYVAADDAVYSAMPGEMLRSVDRARTVTEPARGEQVGGACSVDVLNHGALGTSAQLLGLAGGMLTLSVDYAKQRSQFGRVIGEFQALKHKMAEVAIAVEMARPLLWAAALAVAGNPGVDASGEVDPDAGPRAALDVSAAKVACADAAALAARHALQVHGGIGYTMEHDLGLYLTKARALQTAWGSPAFHRGRVLDALTGGEGTRS